MVLFLITKSLMISHTRNYAVAFLYECQKGDPASQNVSCFFEFFKISNHNLRRDWDTNSLR